MKFFIVLALAAVAVAEPEADAWGLGYNRAVIGAPLVRSSIIGAPLVRSSVIGTPLLGRRTLINNGYAGYAIADNRLPLVRSSIIANRLWKRDAEADAEADPALLVTGNIVQQSGMWPAVAGTPLVRSSIIGAPLVRSAVVGAPLVKSAVVGAPLVNSAVIGAPALTTTYSTGLINNGIIPAATPAATTLLGRTLIANRLWKRDADADAEADPAILATGNIVQQSGLLPAVAGTPLLRSSVIGAPLTRSAVIGTPLLRSAVINAPAVTTTYSTGLIGSPLVGSSLLGAPLVGSTPWLW